MKTYHILNGDGLAARFPTEIAGEILVCRECLIDGPLEGRNLSDFYANRAFYLEETYGDAEGFYFSEVLPEFEAMEEIEAGSAVYFWFEADLFCQLNFWFSASLMDTTKGSKFYLVMPKEPHQYGFSGVNNKELISAQQEAFPLSSMMMAFLQQLWEAYKKGDKKQVLTLVNMLQLSVPALAGVKELLQGFYNEEHIELLNTLITSQKEPDFSKVFQEFCREAPQYGFGDLQLHRIFKVLTTNS